MTNIAQESVTGYKDVSTESKHVLTSTVAQQSVPIASETDQLPFQLHRSMVLIGSRGGRRPFRGRHIPALIVVFQVSSSVQQSSSVSSLCACSVLHLCLFNCLDMCTCDQL